MRPVASSSSSDSNDSNPAYERHRHWRKVLWEDQRFPDNHVDSSFLASLVTNANVRSWQLWDLIDGAGVLSQRISAIVVFAVLFVHLSAGSVDIPLLFAGNWLLVAVAIVLAQWVGQPLSSAVLFVSDPAEAMGGSLLLLLLLFLLSPVLHTLTRSVAEDSVITLAVCLGIVHLAAFDYAASNKAACEAVSRDSEPCATTRKPSVVAAEPKGQSHESVDGSPVSGTSGPRILRSASLPAPQEPRTLPPSVLAESLATGDHQADADERDPRHAQVSETGPRPASSSKGSVGALALGGSTSLNAAVLGSVMLASRLPGPWPVFTLLTVATQVFAVLPVCLARLRAVSTRGHRVASVALPVIALGLLFFTLPSVVPGLVFIVVEVAVVFLAPWLLIQMQSHKRQIQGPWDIATLSGLRH